VATVTARTTFAVTPITDPMDIRLDHLRPSKAKVKQYLSRTMDNGMSDVDFLLTFTSDAYRAKNEGRPANVMLKGDTQSGKTFLVEVLAVAWAEKMGLPKPMPIFTLSGSSGITDYDLFGQTTSYTDPVTGIEALVWLPGLVDLASFVGGILYLDEINAFSERVTSSLHPLTDHRHHFINRNKPVYKNGQFMPDAVTADLDLWIIGTYNEGYRGMSEMNEAFINRFRHICWGYDDAVESKLITSSAIRLLGEALRTARQANQVRTPVGTAALQRAQEDVHTFGVALGMQVFTGMFKPNERPIVQSIIEDRSIFMLLQEELRQDKINDKSGA
jgi:MoxR-like ATPase